MIKDVLENAIISSQEKETTLNGVNDIPSPRVSQFDTDLIEEEDDDNDIESMGSDEPHQITDEELDAMFDKI